jgi:hypothetical protein
MMMVGLVDEVLCLEFQQLIDLIPHVVYGLKGFLFEGAHFLILHLQRLDLLELLVQLLVEGVQHCRLEGQGAATDGQDASGQQL